jgi:hypothetical protein
MFEDNKGIVRNSSSKKDRQCNGKEKKDKAMTCSRNKIAGKNADVALFNNILLTHSHITN